MSESAQHSDRFAGRNALVTGAANDSRACAERLAREGATVGVVDLESDLANSVAKDLKSAGGAARAYGVDVTDEEQVRSAFDDFEQATGKIDILVNMAGVFPQATLQELTLEDWRHVMAVNLDASFLTCKDVLPRMATHKYGRITTVSSATVHIGQLSSAAYISAKAGIIGLTRVLAREGGPDNITANVIMPGIIATEHAMVGDPEEFLPFVKQVQSIERFGQPDDIAEAVAYATCEGAGFLTGQTLCVNGGWTFN